MGLDLVVGLFVIGLLWSRFFPSDQKRARILLNDPRYQKALTLFMSHLAANKGWVSSVKKVPGRVS